MSNKPKTVEDYLNEVQYADLNTYVPTPFALQYLNFIKLVNADSQGMQATPVVHLKMMDQVASDDQVVNLCARGMAKTTLMFEYLVFYLAIFRELPGFPDIDSLIYVSDSMENGVKSAVESVRARYENSQFLQTWLPEAKILESRMEFVNKAGEKFGVKMFGAQSGIRGSKIFSKRPKIAVLDDLLSDSDARSKTVLRAIKDTIYRGVMPALDPMKSKVLFNGTPFAKNDPIIEAVESGAWAVNVWPICEKFPCDKSDFRGAWPDRFSYESVKKAYDMAVGTNETASFHQEYMLQIQSDEDRVIYDGDIRWYDRDILWKNRNKFNWYITSDLATSQKESGDDAAISVWAHAANGAWFWYDGIAKSQLIDKSLDQLFKYAQQHNLMGVGVEVNGQQGGFIAWLQQLMMDRNIWFNLVSSNNGGNPGIRSTGSKFSRFMMVVPLFKNGLIHYPTQMKNDPVVQKHIEQLRLVRPDGFKSKHDDCLDTISQLLLLSAWRPGADAPSNDPDKLFDDDMMDEPGDRIDSYIV